MQHTMLSISFNSMINSILLMRKLRYKSLCNLAKAYNQEVAKPGFETKKFGARAPCLFMLLYLPSLSGTIVTT